MGEITQQRSPQPTANKPRVFVYGSLKAGQSNHRLLVAGGATLLGTDTLSGAYRLVDFGAYPGLVRLGDGSNENVHGEVYQIDDEILASLDILEGHPHYYERIKVQGRFKGTWVYMLPSGFADEGEHCAEGEWPRE